MVYEDSRQEEYLRWISDRQRRRECSVIFCAPAGCCPHLCSQSCVLVSLRARVGVAVGHVHRYRRLFRMEKRTACHWPFDGGILVCPAARVDFRRSFCRLDTWLLWICCESGSDCGSTDRYCAAVERHPSRFWHRRRPADASLYAYQQNDGQNRGRPDRQKTSCALKNQLIAL